MNTVIKEICDFIEDSETLTFVSVADAIGVTKQDMSNYKKRGSIRFDKLMRLAHVVAPNDPIGKMEAWCRRFQSVNNIKQSFEYASITRNVQLLEFLIEKHKGEGGVIGEYVAVYSIIYEYMTDNLAGQDIVGKLAALGKMRDKPLTILMEIVKCYSYYFDKKFHLMLETASEVEKALYDLSDKRELFLKECYLHRFCEIMGPTYLHLNNTEQARIYASIIKNANICAKTVSDASYIIGMTYLASDSEKSIQYFEESYAIAQTVGDEEIEKESRLNRDFAKLYLGIKLDPDASSELLAYESDRKDVSSLLKSGTELFQGEDDDFLQLLKVIGDGSREELAQRFTEYFGESNYFFAGLIAKELKKFESESFMATQLMHLKIGKKGDVHFEENFITSFNSCNRTRRSLCI